MNKDQVIQALAPVAPPAAIRNAAVREGTVSLRLDAPTDRGDYDRFAMAAARAVANAAARAEQRIDSITVELADADARVVHGVTFPPARPPEPGHRPIQGLRNQSAQLQTNSLPGVRHAIAVGAGKGGVGKSTIAVNLAVGLARRGHAAGLMDGDIYGPSIPTMLGLEPLEPVVLRGMLQPFYVHGVKAMTIGKLVDPEKPLIWRGPMAHGAFKQLVEQTEWGNLDHLVIDLPPGTGDVPLTLAQLVRLTGAVIVCTPQRVAQDDAVRAARMFQQLGVEILGVVENMSYFVGDDGKEYDLFGRGGAEKMAARLAVPFLGAVPITMALRENSDAGNPTANFEDPERRASEHVRRAADALAGALENLVSNLQSQLSLAAVRQGATRPTLKIT
jgi:ATP-binding protein involved in chromosome partitioning